MEGGGGKSASIKGGWRGREGRLHQLRVGGGRGGKSAQLRVGGERGREVGTIKGGWREREGSRHN